MGLDTCLLMLIVLLTREETWGRYGIGRTGEARLRGMQLAIENKQAFKHETTFLFLFRSRNKPGGGLPKQG